MLLSLAYHLKICVDLLHDRVRLACAKTLLDPDGGGTSALGRITAADAITEQHDICWDRARAVRAFERYPMIEGERPVKPFLIPADSAGVVPVGTQEGEIGRGQGIRKAAFAGLPSGVVRANFIRILSLPRPGTGTLILPMGGSIYAPTFLICQAHLPSRSDRRTLLSVGGLGSENSCPIFRVIGCFSTSLALEILRRMTGFTESLSLWRTLEGKLRLRLRFAALRTRLLWYGRQIYDRLFGSHRLLLNSRGGQRHAACYQQAHGALSAYQHSITCSILHYRKGLCHAA